MPLAVGGDVLFVEGPGVEGLIAESAGELAGIHRDVAGAGGHGAGVDAWTAVEECRIVAADAIYDLGDFEEAEAAGTAGVVEAVDVVAREHVGEERVEAIGVSWGADFVVVEGGGFVFFEAALNPVDCAGVAVKADRTGPTRAYEVAPASTSVACPSGPDAVRACPGRERSVPEEPSASCPAKLLPHVQTEPSFPSAMLLPPLLAETLAMLRRRAVPDASRTATGSLRSSPGSLLPSWPAPFAPQAHT